MPDDDEEADACNCVPAPFLALGSTIGSEQTSQDHDEISEDSHEDVCTIQSSEKRQIEKEERSSQAPVYIAGPVHLAEDVVVGVWDSVLMSLSLMDVVPVDAALGGHAEVGDGSDNCDQGSDDVIQTAANWNSP